MAVTGPNAKRPRQVHTSWGLEDAAVAELDGQAQAVAGAVQTLLTADCGDAQATLNALKDALKTLAAGKERQEEDTQPYGDE